MSDNFIPLSVEIVDLMIDMLSADARRSYMESEISKLIASKMQALHPSESAGVTIVGWVRCSVQFPDDWIEKIIRNRFTKKLITEIDVKSAEPNYFSMEDGTEISYQDCEWLYESPAVGVNSAVWVGGETWPTDNRAHWRRKEDKQPLLIIGKNYQGNIIAQFGRVYTPQELEWLYESPAAAQSGKEEILSFMNWAYENGYWHASRDRWIKNHLDNSYTASQLYDIYKQQNK